MTENSVWNNVSFVTGNPNKAKEASEILGIELRQVRVDGLFEIQTSDLEELAVHKVSTAYEKLGSPVLIEDSGLIFSAWGQLPGALVKWFEDSVGCDGMLKMLDGFENRRARALCYAALHDGENIHIAKGEVTGTIAQEIRGAGGFGWDVIFIPDGHTRTFAEMTSSEKNAISHRRKAFENLKSIIERFR
jgi:non-canonical purine NTP pyrophosphatase (RdgB/HAM1 family)